MFIRAQSQPTLYNTTWKEPVFGAFLVRIFLHLDWILRISLYSLQMRENADQNNSEYGLFLRSVNEAKNG